MNENGITVEEAANILTGMLDEEQERTERLHQRNKELALLLIENDIAIPEYELWHGDFPIS